MIACPTRQIVEIKLHYSFVYYLISNLIIMNKKLSVTIYIFYLTLISHSLIAMDTEKVPRYRVLINDEEIPREGFNLLNEKYDVTVIDTSTSGGKEQFIKSARNQDALFLATHLTINNETLNKMNPRLKVISTMSAGYDHLDVVEIKKRGIKVGHTPMILTDAVAEIAVMLTLQVSRRAHEGRLKLERGKTENRPQWLLGKDLRNSTVGIVGLGNIGQAVVKRLKPFMIKRFIYSGHSKKAFADSLPAEFVTLDYLLTESDIIIISAPLTNETRNLFNKTTFNKMKMKKPVLVNVGRGQIINTNDLVDALKEGLLFGVGLDVTDPEPLPSGHPLFEFPNVVLLPHLGSATIKTRNDMSRVAAENIINALEGKPMIYEL